MGGQSGDETAGGVMLWLTKYKAAKAENARAAAEAEARAKREEQRREEMRRQETTLLYGLGFDPSDAQQSWLRLAQLLREFKDATEQLRDRVARLEQERDRK